MTKDDIIRMARDCWPSDRRMWSVDADLPRLERFAALVAAAEREACAELCVKLAVGGGFAADCAAAIRARNDSEAA